MNNMISTMFIFYVLKPTNKEAHDGLYKLLRDVPSAKPRGAYKFEFDKEYYGVFLIDTDRLDSFIDWWKSSEDKRRSYVERTKVEVATRDWGT